MRLHEIAPKKPPSPEQARLKSMQQRVKQAQASVAAERQRQRATKASQQLSKLTAPQPQNGPARPNRSARKLA